MCLWGTQKGWHEGPLSISLARDSLPGLIMSSGQVADCHDWECYWYLLGRSQRSCSASSSAQDSPTASARLREAQLRLMELH